MLSARCFPLADSFKLDFPCPLSLEEWRAIPQQSLVAVDSEREDGKPSAFASTRATQDAPDANTTLAVHRITGSASFVSECEVRRRELLDGIPIVDAYTGT